MPRKNGRADLGGQLADSTKLVTWKEHRIPGCFNQLAPIECEEQISPLAQLRSQGVGADL